MSNKRFITPTFNKQLVYRKRNDLLRNIHFLPNGEFEEKKEMVRHFRPYVESKQYLTKDSFSYFENEVWHFQMTIPFLPEINIIFGFDPKTIFPESVQPHPIELETDQNKKIKAQLEKSADLEIDQIQIHPWVLKIDLKEITQTPIMLSFSGIIF